MRVPTRSRLTVAARLGIAEAWRDLGLAPAATSEISPATADHLDVPRLGWSGPLLNGARPVDVCPDRLRYALDRVDEALSMPGELFERTARAVATYLVEAPAQLVEEFAFVDEKGHECLTCPLRTPAGREIVDAIIEGGPAQAQVPLLGVVVNARAAARVADCVLSENAFSVPAEMTDRLTERLADLGGNPCGRPATLLASVEKALRACAVVTLPRAPRPKVVLTSPITGVSSDSFKRRLLVLDALANMFDGLGWDAYVPARSPTFEVTDGSRQHPTRYEAERDAYLAATLVVIVGAGARSFGLGQSAALARRSDALILACFEHGEALGPLSDGATDPSARFHYREATNPPEVTLKVRRFLTEEGDALARRSRTLESVARACEDRLPRILDELRAVQDEDYAPYVAVVPRRRLESTMSSPSSFARSEPEELRVASLLVGPEVLDLFLAVIDASVPPPIAWRAERAVG